MYFIIAFIAGFIVAVFLNLSIMRGRMIERIPVDAPFEEVSGNIGKAIASVEGWGEPIPVWEFHRVILEKGFPFRNLKNMHVYFSCNARYANAITDSYPWIGAIMPCAWAVYEEGNGKVFIAKYNMPLMGMVFTGNLIGKMLTKVARDEKRMLKTLFDALKKRR